MPGSRAVFRAKFPVPLTWRSLAPRLCVVLAYVATAICFSWPLPLHVRSAVLGDVGGDTGVYIWNQWIFFDELSHGRNPFTTDEILSLTSTVDLSQHNYTAFLNLLALPLIPSIGVIAAFNVVFWMITVLTALSTYVLIRRLIGVSRPIAWLSGMLFAWSPVLVARATGHMSLVAAAPLPIFVLCLIRAEETRRTSWAALVGLSVAWAAFCDAYFAVYCVMMSAGLVGFRLLGVRRSDGKLHRPWIWAIDMLLVCTGGLAVGILLGHGGAFTVNGTVINVHGLYTPMLVLATLAVARVALMLRLDWREYPSIPLKQLVTLAAIAFMACAGPLSPVLYGLSRQLLDGRFVSPPTLWRSSPRGVDLLGLFEPNPNHVVVRAIRDLQATDATAFVDYTAALSLIALAVVLFAAWRGHRPSWGWLSLTVGFALLALGPFVIVAGHNTYLPGPWAMLRYVPVFGFARSPARFAIVAALGLAVLFAAALESLRRQSKHPRLLVGIIGMVLVVELCPAPRALYSAEIPHVYRRIAADVRPIRVLELPLGIRDGVFSVGDYTARSQYFQTVHGKKLIGGYLSRISQRRVDEARSQPTLDALLALSEGRQLSAEQAMRVALRAERFLEKSNLGYVVIDHARASHALVAFVVNAWHLEELERDGDVVLYRPTLAGESSP